ncbi:sulfotransferase family 2 domain-containing protein [Neptunomonas phycophila]|uniref:sulfotransferase family 2 domain-containing protein n=1 Tax=Neptunomonas phycophila TaxID=1572645 RepID=UPI0026E31EF7|nr:sulfotransferase family 2 domain-containing protein [Neptunomonas phycophila]MDO6782685.1 sulfotransferase family 2 domain-containing protein [Neptunomonas phycophila]
MYIKKLLVKVKAILKSSSFTNSVSRFFYGFMPLHLKERVSGLSQNPYSDVENNNKIIFVHVPKCAGNAIMKSLFGVKGQGHNKLSDYYQYDKDRFRDFYKFSIVRDPVSRFISAYDYLIQGGMGSYDKQFRDEILVSFRDIDAFVEKLEEDPKFRKKVMSWTHFIPQSEFYDVDGVLALDFLACYDSLDVAYDFLKSKLGVNEQTGLQKVNVTKGGLSKISPKVQDFVKKNYDKDFIYYEKAKNTIS